MQNIDTDFNTGIELRRTIVGELSEFDVFLMEKTNSYHKDKPIGAEAIHDWPEPTILLPDVMSRKFAPYLSDYFDAELGLVWSSGSEFGLEKIRKEINHVGLGKNIQINNMLTVNDLHPRFIDDTPFNLPSGIIYESERVRIHPSIKKKLNEMSSDIGVDNPTLLLLANSIAFKNSSVVGNRFRSASKGTILSMSSKLPFYLKIKSTLLLDHFNDTSDSHLEMFIDAVESHESGDGMTLEGYRWALNQLKKRSKLCGKVPKNPLNKEVIAYKKELLRIITEGIESTSGKIFNKQQVREMNSKRKMVKLIIKDYPFLSDETIDLFKTFDTNVDYINRTYGRL